MIKYLAFVVVLVFLSGKSMGANTYDWTGAVSNQWAAKQNWKLSTGANASVYPGQSGTTDIVRIGVKTGLSVFTNYPVLVNNITIASLTFGNNNAPVGTAGGEIMLTVNSNLTITGAITQKHSSTGGPANSGGTGTVTDFENYTFDVITTLLGTGSITCTSFQVGDNTVGQNTYTVNVTMLCIGNSYTSSNLSITVNGDFILNSSSANNGSVVTKSDRSLVSLQGGTLTITGTLKLTNNNPFYSVMGQYESLCLFSMDLYNNANNAVLVLKGATPVSVGSSPYAANPVDFCNINASGGTGTATVNYAGTNQRIYTFNEVSSPNYWVDSLSHVYQNLIFSGSGTKKVDAGYLTIGNNFTISGTATADLSTNNPITVIGDMPATAGGASCTIGTGTALNHGTGIFTFAGTSFTNSGTTSFGSGAVTFSSSAAASLKTTPTLNFTNVFFTGAGVKTLTSGNFAVINTGVLTMANSGTLAANGLLTLNSDATSSATVAAIPTGCTITGNVNVQRYVSAERGYRLMSSPVYASTVSSNNVYSLNYVKNSAYITGFGGGLDKSGNPTLYLYREDVPMSSASFISGNFRGVNTISAAPLYTIDNDGAGFYIPSGNGFLFFFRGNRADGTVTQETSTSWAATKVTMTATGTLNAGQITFHDWYAPAANCLGHSNSNILVKGFNLAGNPYASSIDWETFNTSDVNTGIYGPAISNTVYELNPATKNYDTYQVGGLATNKGTRTIVSGQGFFVQAVYDTARLVFNESAKSTTQNTGTKLFMGKPADMLTNHQTLRLQLMKDSVNTDDMLLSFNNTAKTEYVQNEDALYKVGSGQVSISSISADQQALAINRLPLTPGQIIPLNVSATTDGSYTLNLSEIVGVPQLFDVWLFDNYKKDSLNMRTSTSYNFNIIHGDAASFGSGRFKIVMRENPALVCQLISFDAVQVGKQPQVMIKWKAVNEQTYTRYAVERSSGAGSDFEIIGGFTSTGQGAYALTDNSPLRGENIYRLKQIDYDNKVTYSKPVTVFYSDQSNELVKSSINVFPNPVTDNLNLAVSKGVASGTYDIEIANSSGLIIKRATTTQPSWQTNAGGMLAGTYFVRVINTKDQKVVGETKFIKL